MTNYQMRQEVAAMYDAPAWKARVSRMPDIQVYAIYRNNKERQQKKKDIQPTPNPYKQLTIWDIED